MATILIIDDQLTSRKILQQLVGTLEQNITVEAFANPVEALEWTIMRIDPGQSVVISYSIKGEGEYHPSDAQIFYNSGD